jgi:hypothetical protein
MAELRSGEGRNARWSWAPELPEDQRRAAVYEECLALARELSGRMDTAGRTYPDPQDHRLRLLRAHALAMVDLLEEAVLQDG